LSPTGKMFMLMRDGSTDLIDVVTCLSLHTVEMLKLRQMMVPLPSTMAILHKGIERLASSSSDPSTVEYEVLSSLNILTEEEIRAFMHLWPSKTLHNLTDILVHHGDYTVLPDPASNDYKTSEHQRWISDVRRATVDLIGDFDSEETDPDDTLVVDIISSNTHSVLNCLSPYLHEHAEEILAWAAVKLPYLSDVPFTNHNDRLYAVAHRFFASFPDKAAERTRVELEHGIVSILQSEFTGIGFQLIDLVRLRAMNQAGMYDNTLLNPPVKRSSASTSSSDPSSSDPNPKHKKESKHRHLLVNIDFAFGEQAYHVIQSLILLFGKCIASINIMGKAGGLVGERGQVLYPTHLISELSKVGQC
jgi:hypothetical protein